MQRLAALLARAGASPNAISLAGMAAGVGAGVALASTGSGPDRDPWLLALAATLVQVRLLCNLMDGMVAIEWNRRTPTGELMNEVPDRISDVATLVGAGYAAGSSPALGYAAALGAVLTAYVRAVGKATTGESDFRGPMAKPQRMFLITLACAIGALAPAVWTPPPGSALGTSPLAPTLAAIAFGSALTCVRRVARVARALEARGA